MRFQVLTALRMKTVFWDAAPCSLVETDQSFTGAYCFHHQGDKQAAREKVGFDTGAGRTRLIVLMMEAGSTSETLVNFYQTTRRSISQNSNPS
jgi:hypothetical protein